jgi:G3E family GTPase
MTTTGAGALERPRVTILHGGQEAGVLAARLARTAPGVAVVSSAPPSEAVPGGVDWAVTAPTIGRRTYGCDCCQVRLDLVDEIADLVRRPRPARHVVVVLDEQDDPTTAAYTVLSDPDLGRLVDLDATIATIDATRAAVRLAIGEAPATPLGLDALAIADLALVARAERVTDEALFSIMTAAARHCRLGRVLAPAIAPVPAADVLHLDAWHGAPEQRRRAPDTNAGDTATQTVWCHAERPLDPGAIDEWFDLVIAEHGARLLRLQGAVTVVGRSERVCCRGVRSWASSHPESSHRRAPSTTSVVAVVGHDLDESVLVESFHATAR